MVDEVGISYEECKEKVIEYAQQNKKGDLALAAYYGVSVPKWHKELERLYPGVKELLPELVARGYKLGVIANQSFGTRERMKNYDIAKYFAVVMASAEEGVAKPDPEIFLRAIREAGCRPEEAIMVGDLYVTIRLKEKVARWHKDA